MSVEDQIRIALDAAAASLRQHLEADLRAFAQEVARASSDDRQALVAAAADERQSAVAAAEAAAAEVRAHAEAQVAQFRLAAQKHAEDVKRAAEGQIGEMRKALDDLRTLAQQQIDAARRIAQAEIEKARGEIEKARGETEKARGEAETARGDAETARAETEHARAETHAVRAESEQAVRTAQARGEQDARAAQAQAEQDARAAQAHAEQAVRSAQAETEKVRDEARSEIARAQVEVEKMRQTAAAEAEEAVVAKLSAASAAGDQKIADAVERAYTDSHESEVSRAARLADAIRNLDEARGLSEVLERLVHCAEREVDRAAILLVKGKRLAGWRLAGFGDGAPAAKSIDLSIADAGLAGAVLETGIAASDAADASDGQRALPSFARDAGARHAMALPVRVGGEVVAVLYADAPRLDDFSSDARWPAVLEVLVRHASRVLEAMTVQQAVGLLGSVQ